jgi:hypothetical protein
MCIYSFPISDAGKKKITTNVHRKIKIKITG